MICKWTLQNITFTTYACRCAWTDLIELPKRSVLPSLLQARGRRKVRGMTNWASYLLPNLALFTDDDPLSLAMAAFCALKMQQKSSAVAFYIKVIRSLQNILRHKNPATIGNEVDFFICSLNCLLMYEGILTDMDRYPLISRVRTGALQYCSARSAYLWCHKACFYRGGSFRMPFAILTGELDDYKQDSLETPRPGNVGDRERQRSYKV